MLALVMALAQAAQPLIVNGSETEAFPEVGALVTPSGGSFCSGTLVAPQWVVTAAHCVEGVGEDDVLFTNGAEASSASAMSVAKVVTHPAYYADIGSTHFQYDVALLELSGPPGVRPMPVNGASTVAQGMVGDDATYVGYGITTDGGFDGGTKRTTAVRVFDVDAEFVYTFDPDTNVCQGDSGGAQLRETETGFELIGVNSFVSGGCVGGAGAAQRVDVVFDWIESYTGELAQFQEDLEEDTGDNAGPDQNDGPNEIYAEDPAGGCAIAPGRGTWLLALMAGLLGMRRSRR